METKSVAIEPKPDGGGPASWPAAIKNYFEELQMEMRRVTWPNEKQVKATTVVVIFSVFAFAAYFFVVDFLILRGVNQIFKVLGK
ncbi:MAG TPA: preprotein translocase subunit SecE [Bryobacteraceae bacterium]|nr:preprotein translocase subunit SecE [Bryobacteraceae bacterium]